MDITMNKLICSFKSDLPNEIEFAMQVAMSLANSDSFTWSEDYQLVDAICSSLHVLTCVCMDNCTSACECYTRFWKKILTGEHAKNPYLQMATLISGTETCFDSLIIHELDKQTRIYKRIKSAAELIRQFAMSCDITHKSEKEVTQTTNEFQYQPIKKKPPKASPPLLKFVSLMLFCDDTPLNHIALDILSNVASKLSKLPDESNDHTCSKLVEMYQRHCVENISCQDGDTFLLIRSIEVISRLISSSNSRVYTSIIRLMNERNSLIRIEHLLTSRNDVTLFLAALEFFYRVSRHQPHLIPSNRAQSLVKFLVYLLGCEDKQFFTEAALNRIELVENEAPESTQISVTNPPQRRRQPPTPAPTPTPTPTPPPPPPSSQTQSQGQQTPVSQHQTPKAPQTQSQTRPQPQRQLAPQPISQPVTNREYACEWHECNRKFPDPKSVYTHVFETHVGILGPNEVSACLWTGPNGYGPGCQTKRPKFSLLTHLNDFHCNATALQRAQVRPPEHPGYGPNAALAAIRRHATLDKSGARPQNNSPLSVSVRLTAALTLRNLAAESTEMKQALANHEPLLSEICMTNGRDESKIIAECLSLFSSD